MLTALANDVGYELVFSRQIIAHARPGDIAIGFSTSGGSVNVIRAFEEAPRRRLLTIGLVRLRRRRDGRSDALDHCLVVPPTSVHRIQETQAALMCELWSMVQRVCSRRAGGRPMPRPTSSSASRRSGGATRACSTRW